ncbi:Mtp [Drosophila busckii]|uniref:Mtp n=1 Tax=Drosophila busckii TaxID=30019 RepID=A0A0M4ESK4_DROBS|nr:Mtp [Drosophila busckii]
MHLNRRKNNNNVWLLLLLSTVTAGASLIPPGTQQLYTLQSQVSLDQLQSAASQELGYNFETKLKINSVWSKNEEQLLQLYFGESRVAAGDKQREIKTLPDRPFYIALVKGQPQQVIAHTSRDESLLNLERGIASLLQLRHSDSEETELDVSGHCRVRYEVKSSTRVEKTKTDCALWDLRVSYHPEQALGVDQQSQEQVQYELSADGALLRAQSTETHRLSLAAKSDAGSLVRASLKLEHVAEGAETVQQLQHESLEAAIESLLEWYRVFELEANLLQQFEHLSPQLQSEHVGKSSLALAFAQLLPLARLAKQPEFEQLLQSQSKLAVQLVDLLGAVQTFEAHNATFAHLYQGSQTKTEQMELLEKYLQSLAVATHPERRIVEHLYNFLQQADNKAKQSKLRDTVLQTLAVLARQSGFADNDQLLQQIRVYLLEGLATDDATLYIRALQNLRDLGTIDALLEQATHSKDVKVSVAALQALKAFPANSFAQPQRRQFESIFYQHRRRYDSSARTLALDVLLSMRPDAAQLGALLDYLASNDRQFEIKTYVLQKLRMLSELCPRFRAAFLTSLRQRSHVNNYHVLGQRGLTTVLSRQLSHSPAFNESLLSIQEVSQGILKRGSVEFLLHAGREQASSFKLGIYTAGLGSMVGDSDADAGSDNIPADDELEQEETITAGMEISVQGSQLRPLVFFSGQTELMGHVWGGTASDSTPAYQATTLAQDHEQYIVLSSGATLYWRILGARSVDLNGKVNFSLWNRNAQTEIQQNTGSAVVGRIAVGFTYAKLVQDFSLTHEPKLSLNADLDFYSGIKLCMQLQSPDQLLTYNNTRAAHLQAVAKPYVKYLRSSRTHKSAGRTFSLNQKNNDMCNMIFADY